MQFIMLLISTFSVTLLNITVPVLLKELNVTIINRDIILPNEVTIHSELKVINIIKCVIADNKSV